MWFWEVVLEKYEVCVSFVDASVYVCNWKCARGKGGKWKLIVWSLDARQSEIMILTR